MNRESKVAPIVWDTQLQLLDQRLLPHTETYLDIGTVEEAGRAIADLVVRGAPAIGITAAYGVVLACRQYPDMNMRMQALDALADARPTAVNLRWAVERMRSILLDGADDAQLEAEAKAIHEADIKANLTMGELGAQLIHPGSSVLTHCNTGSLATGGYGTALGVIRSAYALGRLTDVYAGETRPWLQGARLTAWELQKDGIPVHLVIEGAVASLFAAGKAKWLIVGADRVVANGDTANKIGTLSAAVHAKRNGAQVMVVIPTTTLDLGLESGDQIPIEERGSSEILSLGGNRVAADGAGAWNPVFNITPAELIDCIVTEKGVARPPFKESLAALKQ